MGKNLSNYISHETEYKFITIKNTYIVFYKIITDEIRIVRVF